MLSQALSFIVSDLSTVLTWMIQVLTRNYLNEFTSEFEYYSCRNYFSLQEGFDNVTWFKCRLIDFSDKIGDQCSRVITSSIGVLSPKSLM